MSIDERDEAALEINVLKQRLAEAEYAYYSVDAPIMSDFDYDLLMRRLEEIESAYPELIDPASPTQRVGGSASEAFAAVTHRSPMMSLDDIFDEKELSRWFDRLYRSVGTTNGTPSEISDVALVSELKIDGLAVSLTYVDGLLVQGATRGNGLVGEDVTHNVLVIDAIPRRLRSSYGVIPTLVEVRGEIYLPLSAFDELNKRAEAEGRPRFVNPRNTAAGSLRQKDPSMTSSRGLAFWSYQLGAIEGGPNFTTHHETLEYLGSLGLPVNDHVALHASMESVFEELHRWSTHRYDLNYDIDGIVIKVDSLELRSRLGSTSRAPRWAAAFKFPPEERTTLLVDIQVSIGKSGKATPFAVLEPVFVGGSTVALATLHNEDQVALKDIRPGDTVIVRKAGDVIPEVVGSVPGLRPDGTQRWTFPTQCPVCGSGLVREEGESDHFCPNRLCESQVIQRIVHYGSRVAMDIEGLGEQRVTQFVRAGLITDPADLYQLRPESLRSLEKMGAKSATALIEAIEGSKSRPLDKVINGLAIRHVGAVAATLLSRRFGRLTNLRNATLDELEEVEGIGAIIAESVMEFMTDAVSSDLLDRLSALGVGERDDAVRSAVPQSLMGVKIVVSGSLRGYSREGAEKAITDRGGKTSGSVSSKTTYLVVGDEPGATKVAKAEALGTRILNEAEFDALLSSGVLP